MKNELAIPTPNFWDPITGKIMQLENLRVGGIVASTPPPAFIQLHGIFKMTESLASAHIEGNHTTISDYVQDKIEGKDNTQEHKEISNIEDCMTYVNEEFKKNHSFQVSEFFLNQLHQILTRDLTKEGSKQPGGYRTHNVTITQSAHVPPEPFKIQELMSELIQFINKKDPPQSDLLKVAVAHHRFVWIHPYDNGNGRMARLLTYIMLRQYGFYKVSFLNPSAVFCQDRSKYIDGLTKADTGTEENIICWCNYVLDGLLKESQKIQKLLNKEFLDAHIILPAIQYSLNNRLISDEEFSVLKLSTEKSDYTIMVKDLKGIFQDKTDSQLTYLLKQMRNKHLLRRENDKSRKYMINLNGYKLTRGMLESLVNENFVELK